jgi:hypothetical protein
VIHPAIYDALIGIARERETVTYGEIGRQANLDMMKPPHRAVLGLMLDEIDRHEHAAGRPLLSAVVVLKQTGVSSRGFFACARTLGVETGPDERDFWAAELRRVYDYWAHG